MVHKCSEYRLQFRQLTNNIRAEIWRENISFRELQKRKNLSDHYWRYQLIDEQCECDDGISEFTTEEKTHGVASPFLLHTSNNNHQEPSAVADQAVQTPNWTVSNDKNSCSASRMDDAVTFCSESISPPKETTVEGTEEPANSHSVVPKTALSPSAKPVELKTCSQQRDKSPSHVSKAMAVHNNINYFKDDAAISHLNPSPTRDALRFYKKEKNPVFVAFGWNDNDKDVGDRKTHNVRAPASQVNPSALQALEKKQNELEKYFIAQRGWKRHQQSLLSLMPVDYNVWMTEYQEKFCKDQRDFIYNPNKIYSRRKPVVWRHSS